MLEGLFGSSGLLELEIEPPAQDQPKTKPPICSIGRAQSFQAVTLVLSTSGSQARLAEDGRALDLFWDELRAEAGRSRISELAQQGHLQCGLSLWLPNAKQFQLKVYDSKGKLTETGPLKTGGLSLPQQLKTHRLQPSELALLEIQAVLRCAR